MTPELTVLALTVILQCLQLGLYSIVANRQVGVRYSGGPRDEPRQLTGIAGRVQRSVNNQFESLILFTAAVVVLHLSNNATPYTAVWAWIYLAARVLYIPAYMFAWTYWRSAIWGVGLLATLVMIFTALL
jgi:uncharacterized MAPEG superfamily protein